jgi:geranylgeranyl diphosphate synthase type II
VEYIHTYSLVHDDLPAMDDDELRRGKPTNHMVYGEAVAILAGDGLLSSAFEAMGKDMLLYMDKPKELIPRVKALSAIAKGAGCRGMVGGQVADIEAVSKAVSPALLDYIHIGKTAALFEACVKAGGHLGGADKAGIEALSNYGENLGLAFQIADDILDVQGSQDEMGKVVGRDEELHKATYPAVHGMQESQARLIALTEAAVASLEPFGDKAEFLRYVANMLTERTK